MPGKVVDFGVVRELACALPGIEAGTAHGAPTLKLHGRLLACPAIHKSAEPHSLVVKIPLEQRATLIAEHPDLFYVTDHYLNYPSMLVRLSKIRPDELRDLLAMAWRFVSDQAGKRRRR
jgi:hypothetical protein